MKPVNYFKRMQMLDTQCSHLKSVAIPSYRDYWLVKKQMANVIYFRVIPILVWKYMYTLVFCMEIQVRFLYLVKDVKNKPVLAQGY